MYPFSVFMMWMQIFVMLLFFVHPMSICWGMLLVVTFLCIFMSYLSCHWVSYFLFLLLVGGLMVLFFYISTMSPSIKSLVNISYMYCSFILQSVGLMMLLMSMGMNSLVYGWSITEDMLFPLQLLYMNNFMIMYFILLILLILLFLISKMCVTTKSPLRNFI